MLLLNCPACGVTAEETEFAAYLFERKNPRGPHFERWRHAFGCGKWFHVARDTATLEVFGSYSAQATEPPEEILAVVRARNAGWQGWT